MRGAVRRAVVVAGTLVVVLASAAGVAAPWTRPAEHIYWANAGNGTIGRANLNGTGASQSFITGASFPAGVAVNGSHLYWANNGTNTIGRANLNGTGASQSFITGANGPTGVAVTPSTDN
jgi:virginiamycin B lyase